MDKTVGHRFAPPGTPEPHLVPAPGPNEKAQAGHAVQSYRRAIPENLASTPNAVPKAL